MTDQTANTTNAQTSSADNLDAELASLPAKYQGKSVADIAKMHQEAERRLSQQGQELGEWRTMANSLVGVERATAKKPEPRKPVTVEEVLTDPDKALNEAIQNHPAIKSATDAAEQLRRTQALTQFKSEFPDFQTDLADQEFKDWIAGSKARANLAIKADQFDIDAARDLWSLWAETKEVRAAKAESEGATKKAVRNDKLNALTLEGRSGTQIDATKRFNRAEMVALNARANQGDKAAQAKWNDPVFQKARLQAYRDGRVD